MRRSSPTSRERGYVQGGEGLGDRADAAGGAEQGDENADRRAESREHSRTDRIGRRIDEADHQKRRAGSGQDEETQFEHASGLRRAGASVLACGD